MEDLIIDRVARALWECDTHPLMKAAGHATEWPELATSVKRSMLREARIAINAYELAKTEVAGNGNEA